MIDGLLTPDQDKPRDDMVDILAAACEPGERPVAAFFTLRFKLASWEAKGGTAMVTDRRLLLAKDRLIGHPRADFSLALSDLAGSDHGPLRGVGPTWEVRFVTHDGREGSMYFTGPTSSELAEESMRTQAVQLQRPAAHGVSSDQIDLNMRVLDALEFLAVPEQVGRPFGEGFGLDGAIEALAGMFSDRDQLRTTGGMYATTVIGLTGKGYFLPDDLSQAMGATEEAFAASGVTPSAFGAVTSLAGAAESFLAQFDEEGSLWDLWLERDDVVREFLCWHCVALLRLVTTGKLPIDELRA